jgi:hypothetical protein
MTTQHAPSLRFQAHLAFPQGLPTIQKCQKSLQARPTPTHGLKDSAAKIKDILANDKNGQLVTKCKCHKGFRGMRGSEVRFYFSCNLIGNHPQSLTALTLNR